MESFLLLLLMHQFFFSLLILCCLLWLDYFYLSEEMMIEHILWGIFLLLLIYYSIFLVSILRGLSNLNQSKSELTIEEYISVIIPFRNESENIIENVKSIINQDYPHKLPHTRFSKHNGQCLAERQILPGKIHRLNLASATAHC